MSTYLEIAKELEHFERVCLAARRSTHYGEWDDSMGHIQEVKVALLNMIWKATSPAPIAAGNE